MPIAAMPSRITEHLQRLSLASTGRSACTTTPDSVRSWLLSRPDAIATLPGEATAKLLLFCLSDVNMQRRQAVEALAGLRCIPQADGTLGSLSRPSSSAPPIFLASPDEQELLTSSCAGGGLLGSMVVDGAVLRLVPGLVAALDALAGTGWLNLRRLTAADLAESLLPALLPEVPRGSRSVPWQRRPLEGKSAGDETPSEAWVALLWRCLGSYSSLKPFEDARLPVVPTAGGHLHMLAPLPATALLRCPPGGWGERQSAVLELLGCHLVPSDSPAAVHLVCCPGQPSIAPEANFPVWQAAEALKPRVTATHDDDEEERIWMMRIVAVVVANKTLTAMIDRRF
jgi:hypothetical protein